MPTRIILVAYSSHANCVPYNPSISVGTRPARRCQNCQIVHQGGQEPRPCPHCTSEIKPSAWPQHVRACTGDPTDATEETDPDPDGDGDPAITNSDTQQATSPTTRTSGRAHARSHSELPE